MNDDFFLNLGNEIMGRQNRVAAKTMNTRFRASFGTSPTVCANLWSKLISHELMPEKGKPIHLLWALMFLKLYCSEPVLAAIAGVHEQTFRKWAWSFVDAISDLQYFVIMWENRLIGDIGNECLVSVDGTDFKMYEWGDFWSGWYSHKFKAPGLRYEVGVCIRTGHIVWIHGPFPCGKWSDLKIFRQGLKNMLQQGEKVQADGGYRGESNHIVTPTGVNDMGQKVRARHETVNRRFKQFNILQRVFRHELVKHQAVFLACAVITQLALESGEPLYGVNYFD